MQVAIGKIVNTQGIKGEVRVLSNSDFKDLRFVVGNELYIKMKDEYLKVKIEKYYQNKTFDIIKFYGYDNINEVIKFKNCMLYAEQLADTDLAEGEYLTNSLVGMKVIDQLGNSLGSVDEVIENPAHNILRVKADQDSFLVPFNQHFIIEVDTDERIIKIELIDGLINEN